MLQRCVFSLGWHLTLSVTGGTAALRRPLGRQPGPPREGLAQLCLPYPTEMRIGETGKVREPLSSPNTEKVGRSPDCPHIALWPARRLTLSCCRMGARHTPGAQALLPRGSCMCQKPASLLSAGRTHRTTNAPRPASGKRSDHGGP